MSDGGAAGGGFGPPRFEVPFYESEQLTRLEGRLRGCTDACMTLDADARSQAVVIPLESVVGLRRIAG